MASLCPPAIFRSIFPYCPHSRVLIAAFLVAHPLLQCTLCRPFAIALSHAWPLSSTTVDYFRSAPPNRCCVPLLLYHAITLSEYYIHHPPGRMLSSFFLIFFLSSSLESHSPSKLERNLALFAMHCLCLFPHSQLRFAFETF